MKLFGFEITRRQKAVVAPTDLSPTIWTPLIHEGGTGYWQRGIKVDRETQLSFSALFACVTLIASDISKLGLRLVQEDENGIWKPAKNPAYSPVLRKPNRYQSRIKFIETWILSKLVHGNAYVLKVRDNRNVVVALYILDPRRVRTLVAPGAAVFYQVQADNLSTVGEAVTIPASEIIHDVMNPIFHPLVGYSPISACGLAAAQGIEIQKTSARFFQNGARPGGVLTAPGTIQQATAERLKAEWDQKFGGENVGKVAVLGDGLKFEHLSVTPIDAQLIEQLKYSSEMVCTAFHVPPYKIGVGPVPTYQNAAVLNQIYYSDCLQKLIEDLEIALDEGLALPDNIGVELNLDDLLRMDAQTQMLVLKEGVSAGVVSPNEARFKVGLGPVEGGELPYLQQQNFSLADLAKRSENPLLTPQAATPEPEVEEPEEAPAERERRLLEAFGNVVSKQIEEAVEKQKLLPAPVETAKAEDGEPPAMTDEVKAALASWMLKAELGLAA